MQFYVEEGGEVQQVTAEEWARDVRDNDQERIKARALIGNPVDKNATHVEVVTRFVGIEDGDELALWQSYVRDGPLDGATELYATEADARNGHANMVKRAIKAFLTHAVDTMFEDMDDDEDDASPLHVSGIGIEMFQALRETFERAGRAETDGTDVDLPDWLKEDLDASD